MPFDQGHALVIGVGTHAYAPSLNAPITVADSQAVADVLKDPRLCGYPDSQVTLLSEAAATSESILAAINGLAQTAQPEDTVFLFYAGHGDYGADGDYYLVSHDAQLSNGKVVAGTGINEKMLLDALRKIEAMRVLLIFNACHSGEISPGSLSADDASLSGSNVSEDLANRLLATGSGRIVMTACRESQRSYFLKSEALTIFAQAIVDALRGKGVTSRGGFITAFDLYTSVWERVTERMGRLGRQQEPELTVIKGIGPFAVSLCRGATATLGLGDEPEAVPEGVPVRQVAKEKIERISQQWIRQSGGVNFGQGNRVSIRGDVVGGDKVGGDKIDARDSRGFINKPSGPVTQHFGAENINTGGAAYVGGNVTTGRDFIGRDQVINTGGAPQESRYTHGDFDKVIAALRAALQTSGLDEDVKTMVSQSLDHVEAQSTKVEAKSSSILVGLNAINGMLEDIPGATKLMASVQTAIQIAKQVF